MDKDNTNYIPKHIILFKTILVCSIFFTFGTAYRSNIFYFYWISGGLLILFFILKVIKTQKVNRSLFYTFLYMCSWCILNILLTPYAFNKQRHLKVIILTIFYTLISILLLQFVMKSKKYWIKIFYNVNVFWIFLNIVVFFLDILEIHDVDGSFSGVFVNRNSFAINTIFLISILIFFGQCLEKKQSRKLKSLIILSVFFTIISYSFKGFIGLLILFTFYYFDREIKLNRRIKYIFLVIVILVSGLSLEGKMFNRISMYFNVISCNKEVNVYESNSAMERESLIKQGLNLAKQNIWTGIGVDNSRYFLYVINKRGNEKYLYSHNNYIEMLLNGGIFVFLLYYVPILIILLKFLKNRRKNKIIRYGIMLIFLKLFWDIGMVSYNNFTNIFMQVFFSYIFFEYKYNRESLIENFANVFN